MPDTLLKFGDTMMDKNREGPGPWGAQNHEKWK